MGLSRQFLVAGAAAILTVWPARPLRQAPPANGEQMFGVSVSSVEVAEVSSDRVTLRIGMRLKSKTKVPVRGFALNGVRVNGVPVYVPPVIQRVDLEANRP